MANYSPAGERIFIALIVGLVISCIAVLLRFYCKFIVKSKLQLDDAWLIFAMLSYFGAAGFIFWGLQHGGGGLSTQELITQGKFAQIKVFLYSLFTGLNLYLCAVYGLKMTLLTFYQRIFVTKTYRHISIGIMAASTIWVIGAIAGVVTNCKPVNHFWNRLSKGTCSNFNTYAVATGVTELLLDLAILILPIRMVFTLQLPLRTKVVLASIFMLGGFAMITAILRIIYLYQKNEIFVDFANGQFWSAIHLATGTVCVCAPIYKPLWGTITTAVSEIRKNYGFSLRSLLGRTSKNSKSSKNKTVTGESQTYITLDEGYKVRGSESSKTVHGYERSANTARGNGNKTTVMPKNAILRSQEYEVNSIQR